MHELSIASYLLDAVEAQGRANGATRVVAINLVVGDRSGIVDDSLDFCLKMLAPGMLAEGARLKIRRTPMRFHCASCHAEYAPGEATFDCPACGVVGQVVDDGSGLLIESIEVET
jgi:hydrogenase nickel incorporation protein HypA/HybF